jgi:hypothetical protein
MFSANVPGIGVVGFVVGQVRLENQSRLARVSGSGISSEVNTLDRLKALI